MTALSPDTKLMGFGRRTVPRIMTQVMLALVPGTLVLTVLIDARVLSNILIAVATALCFEAVALHLRKRPVKPALSDGSITLAAWLLALCVPPSLPLWQLVVGVGVMVTLGKHLYGGLGHNPFNPAMVAYAVLIVSFPVTMTDWSSPTGDAVITSQSATHDPLWDALTGATPLDRLREIRHVASRTPASSASSAPMGSIGSMNSLGGTTATAPASTSMEDSKGSGSSGSLTRAEVAARAMRTDSANSAENAKGVAAIGAEDGESASFAPGAAGSLDALHESPEPIPGITNYPEQSTRLIMHSAWTWVSLAWLCGGLYLLLIRVISWHIPVALLVSLAVSYTGYALIAASMALPVIPALLSGAIMLGAFFIATDPVSAATSSAGKLVYGAGTGLLTFIIREFSSYPEGFAFAILLMNICVPLIDYLFTGPRGKLRSSSS